MTCHVCVSDLQGGTGKARDCILLCAAWGSCTALQARDRSGGDGSELISNLSAHLRGGLRGLQAMPPMPAHLDLGAVLEENKWCWVGCQTAAGNVLWIPNKSVWWCALNTQQVSVVSNSVVMCFGCPVSHCGDVLWIPSKSVW